MSPKISKELSKHRLEQAKEDLTASKILYDMQLFKSANNRAYYSIFHSMKAILVLEPIDFASRIREDSDYDDEFVVRPEDTLSQIETAKEIIELAKNYINAKK